jgi:hypothetical protein
VELVALPLIIRRFRAAGRAVDAAACDELMKMVKIYNPVPEDAEGIYREAVLREYQAYCQRESRP